jgi:hypothetical protein
MVAGMGLLVGLNRRLLKRYRLIELGKSCGPIPVIED